MKQLFILIMVIGMGIHANAQENKLVDYVIANGNVFYGCNLDYGIVKTKNFLVCKNKETGEKIKFNYKEVSVYRMDGITYEKMPIVHNGKTTKSEEFMECIAYRNGLKLYRYNNPEKDLKNNADYLIFEGKKFVVDVNEKTKENLVGFFNFESVEVMVAQK